MMAFRKFPKLGLLSAIILASSASAISSEVRDVTIINQMLQMKLRVLNFVGFRQVDSTKISSEVSSEVF